MSSTAEYFKNSYGDEKGMVFPSFGNNSNL